MGNCQASQGDDDLPSWWWVFLETVVLGPLWAVVCWVARGWLTLLLCKTDVRIRHRDPTQASGNPDSQYVLSRVAHGQVLPGAPGAFHAGNPYPNAHFQAHHPTSHCYTVPVILANAAAHPAPTANLAVTPANNEVTRNIHASS